MTYQPKSEFLRVMETRGYIADCTDLQGLDELLLEGPVTAYIGYDCTGPSLHVGHLVNIMMLRWFQKTGNRPIALMGGGTTRIGDPSGKDEARQLLTDEKIAENMASLRGFFANYITFAEDGGNAIQPNNADWLDGLGYIPFLREYGRHFTINRMLSFESVKGRLDREQPLTFLEFNYMLLQAYDFLELYRREGCRLQMGGSDQWGNIVNGIDLTRRIAGMEVFGLTTPLLTTASGAKMGKTAQGAVWLNGDMLSPYDFWQFWRNTADADVGRFLRLFTELELDEIARLERLEGQEINTAKVVLANAATTLAHGAEAAAAAEATARETFEAGGAGADLPMVTLSAADVGQGISVAQLFVRAGLAASGKEAKRLVNEGGARINDAAVTDPGQMIGAEALAEPLKLSAGKKRHALARLG
ncbi:tyrosine--tRNA ligase [Paralimibaculum aggregatum]|uniref:Tyrosine--tRNA ligase n=1 Tax=Paralimibaculum aggregatum TaxID=3036245 RepID=A0ABQ6LR81_9RHOB|nr:tyrosine--tRNA ligase [Limibaculum sp. NKW23]GMG83571.1 tyrosine--tRNA ligase [Limibaculum sp. NKW23]